MPRATRLSPVRLSGPFSQLAQAYGDTPSRATPNQLLSFSRALLLGLVADLFVYIALTRLTLYFTGHLTQAKGVSFLVGMICTLLLARRSGFAQAGRQSGFWRSSAVTLLANVASFFVLLRAFHFHDVPVFIGASLVTAGGALLLPLLAVTARRYGSALKVSIPLVDLLILIGLVLVTMVSAALWLSQDTMPPHWDMAAHLSHSLMYTDILRAALASRGLHELAAQTFQFFVHAYFYYPPFAYWTSVPFILVIGRTVMAAAISNVVFATILAGSAYGLGRTLWNRNTGLLAAVTMLSYPFVVAQFHEYQLDMPLTAMSLLALYALVRAKGWSSRFWSFGFGTALGLGMLTKWTLAGFLIVPAVYALLGAVWTVIHASTAKRPAAVRALATGLGLSLLGLLLTAGPWFLLHLHAIRIDFAANAQTGIAEGDPLVGSLLSLRYYYDTLIAHQIRLLLLVPLLIGIVASFFTREYLRRNAILIVYVVAAYAVMTQYQNKDYRFIEPLLAGAVVLTVYWVTLLPRPLRYLGACSIIGICAFQFVTVSWGQKLLPSWPYAQEYMVHDPISKEVPVPITLYRLGGYTSASPKQQAWLQLPILTAIENDRQERGYATPVPVALYYQDAPWFNQDNFAYYRLQTGYLLQIVTTPPIAGVCQGSKYVIVTQQAADAYAALTGDGLAGCSIQPIYRSALPDQTGVMVGRVVAK